MLDSIRAMLIPTRLAGWLVVRQPALRRWTLVNLKEQSVCKRQKPVHHAVKQNLSHNLISDSLSRRAEPSYATPTYRLDTQRPLKTATSVGHNSNHEIGRAHV